MVLVVHISILFRKITSLAHWLLAHHQYNTDNVNPPPDTGKMFFFNMTVLLVNYNFSDNTEGIYSLYVIM